MFIILWPVLLGTLGLTIDTGLMMVVYRQTQNAAEAGALAAAVDLKNGVATGTAKTTGATYIQTYNNMANATVTINIPPASGPHSGSSSYAEAIVSSPYKASFIPVLGLSQNESVTARAVAGYHLSAPAEGIMTLQQSSSAGGGAGLTVSGGGILSVAGPIVDNSTHSSQALDVSDGSIVYATKVSVSGGASGTSAVEKYPSGGGTSPLAQNTGVNYADPLANLTVPTTGTGVITTNYGTLSGSTLQGSASPQDVTVTSGQAVNLMPGIYRSITVQEGGKATLASGIYVLAGGGLTVSGGSTLSGSGVMFYNTAASYDATTGAGGSNPSFGSINITGSTGLSLSGINNPSSPYNGMLVFQDRSNTQPLIVSGGTGAQVSGTFYAPTANLMMSGGATYNSQFIVGSMNISSGSSNVIIVPSQSQANLVYLVE
jgi:hypothetical protein